MYLGYIVHRTLCFFGLHAWKYECIDIRTTHCKVCEKRGWVNA